MDRNGRKDSGRTWCELDTLNFGTGGRRSIYDTEFCVRRCEKRMCRTYGAWSKCLGDNREAI